MYPTLASKLVLVAMIYLGFPRTITKGEDPHVNELRKTPQSDEIVITSLHVRRDILFVSTVFEIALTTHAKW